MISIVFVVLLHTYFTSDKIEQKIIKPVEGEFKILSKVSEDIAIISVSTFNTADTTYDYEESKNAGYGSIFAAYYVGSNENAGFNEMQANEGVRLFMVEERKNGMWHVYYQYRGMN